MVSVFTPDLHVELLDPIVLPREPGVSNLAAAQQHRSVNTALLHDSAWLGLKTLTCSIEVTRSCWMSCSAS